MSDVLRSRAPLPLIPPAPFSHTGRRGNLGAFAPHPPAPFSHTGRRGSLGVLMLKTREGRQELPKNLPLLSVNL